MSLSSRLQNLLAHPLTKGLDLDDPATTELRRRIIKEKEFCRRLYMDFYGEFLRAKENAPSGAVLELGSGGGFFKDVLPHAMVSEIISVPDMDVIFDAHQIPLADNSLSLICMLNVFHHLCQPAGFLNEAARCLAPGGRMVMIEPANTKFARIIYQNLHHELFDTQAGRCLPPGGPLSQGNGALPWIVFCRDEQCMPQECPALKIQRVELHTPFAYLLSGGVSMRSFLPGLAYQPVRAMERALGFLNPQLAMFMTVELVLEDSGQ